MKAFFVQENIEPQIFNFFFLEKLDFLLKENHLGCVSRELVGMLRSRREGIEKISEKVELLLNPSAFSLKSHANLLCSTRLREILQVTLIYPTIFFVWVCKSFFQGSQTQHFQGQKADTKRSAGYLVSLNSCWLKCDIQIMPGNRDV